MLIEDRLFGKTCVNIKHLRSSGRFRLHTQMKPKKDIRANLQRPNKPFPRINCLRFRLPGIASANRLRRYIFGAIGICADRVIREQSDIFVITYMQNHASWLSFHKSNFGRLRWSIPDSPRSHCFAMLFHSTVDTATLSDEITSYYDHKLGTFYRLIQAFTDGRNAENSSI